MPGRKCHPPGPGARLALLGPDRVSFRQHVDMARSLPRLSEEGSARGLVYDGRTACTAGAS